MTSDGLSRVTDFVETELDFATSHYNDDYLRRRIDSRLHRVDADDYAGYLDLLRRNESEQAALLDALNINVTGFFRNPDVWTGIRELLRQADGPVSVWCGACADGREPYSLAMVAHDDPGIDPESVSILGTDINDRALAIARRGVYRDLHVTDIAGQLEFLSEYDRYVDQRGDEFVVREPIRESVRFERHDLINDDPKNGFDLVMCRNLLIYIDGEYKEPVVDTLAASLHRGGILVIGKSESLPPAKRTEFTALDNRLRMYRRD